MIAQKRRFSEETRCYQSEGYWHTMGLIISVKLMSGRRGEKDRFIIFFLKLSKFPEA